MRARCRPVLLLASLSCASALAIAGCGDDGETTSGGGSDGTAASTGTAGSIECDGDTCDAATEYCGFAAGACEGTRTCQPYPECTKGEVVVCACNGENYDDPCLALEVSGGAIDGACPAPEGQFACNYEYQIPTYCDLATEYCKVTPAGGAYDLDCAALPAECGDAPEDCACTNDSCAENYCGIDEETGSMTILCPLPG